MWQHFVLPRPVKVGHIKPSMHMRKVSIQGLLASDARRLDDGSVMLLLADETGTLPLFLMKDAGHSLPRSGTRFRVEGYLSVGMDGRARMRVESFDDLVETEGPLYVTLSGEVKKVELARKNSNRPSRIIVSTSYGRMVAVYWFSPTHHPAVGERIELSGHFELYKGEPQLRLNAPSAIQECSDA